MIPQKLELKNFLCYADKIQTVDFKQYDLICLSGKNGHGKSALLDAMTWALWGQARKISGAVKADEGLLRLGQTRMMVSFEFGLADKVYRVRREFAKTYGKPYVSLDIELFDQTQEKFISLTDKTIKITQEKIEQIVGLSFDTFINSAFLKQGQSNEFSKKTPKERKDILAAILNLSRYDALAQHALDIIRKNTNEKQLLTKLQEQCSLELEREQEIKDILDVEEKKRTSLADDITALHAQLFDTEQKLKQSEEQFRYHNLLTKDHQTIQQTIQKLLQLLVTERLAWKAIHTQALALPDLGLLEKQKKLLLGQEKTYIDLQKKSISIQETILKHKEQYQNQLALLTTHHEKEHTKLILALQHHEFGIKQLSSTYEKKKLEHQQRLAELKKLEEQRLFHEKQLQAKTSFDKSYEKLKTQFDKRRSWYQTLIQRANQCTTALKDVDLKKKVATDTSNPACPLCQQMLTAKRKQFLTKQFGHEQHFFQHRLDRLTHLISNLKSLLLEQHKELEKNKAEHDSFTQLDVLHQECKKKILELTVLDRTELQELAKLEQELLIAHKQGKELQTDFNAHEKKRTDYEQDPSLKKTLDALANLEEEKQQYAFDQTTYTKLQTHINDIEKTIANLETLKQERDKQQERKTRITQLCSQLKQNKTALSTLERQIKAHTFDPAIIKTQEQCIITLKKEITHKLEEKEKILTTIGKLENELQRFAQLKHESKTRAAKLYQIQDEIEDHQALAQAFSKNGIQALLIEEAIPEIEQEANDILTKLTDNQAQIFIESLKDLKSGGVKETLDIKISDAAGLRPYEMYSGGEAFRIDFALRIAISKLLARRAGTALQTLIIDEGFGSQDEEGLTRLMKAIHTIKQDFSKVIIVSHLNEFKDNFPAHFIVEKTAAGSVINIEERG
ncbi:MAG: SMC family ATPase [bacterium]